MTELPTARERDVEDRARYEALFATHADRLRRLCRLLLSDRTEADDVVQEVFLKAYEVSGRLDPPRNWAAWLTRVTVNACRDRHRVGWWPRWRRMTDCLEDMALPDAGPTPEQAAIGRETQDRIWRAFRELSGRQREVFVLRQLEGWSTAAVATALGLREGSVKSHLFRALRHLRAAAGAA